MALQETFCNHYRRAASDVNIFNFFNGRIGLDGRNDQTGALGIPGIAFGAVSGKLKIIVKLKIVVKYGHIWSISRNSPKRGMKSLPMGPSSHPEPAQGVLAPSGATPAHMGARAGWWAYKYGAVVGWAMGWNLAVFSKIRSQENKI